MVTKRAPQAPPGLDARGLRLWRATTKLMDFNPAEMVILEEACRITDRLDKLDQILAGADEGWARLRLPSELAGETVQVTLVLDHALAEARMQATVVKQLLVALRIPDGKTAERPQQRGGARGAYQPTGKVGGNVTAIDRARSRTPTGT